jgi:IclR family acetate operon transcriptional repressor
MKTDTASPGRYEIRSVARALDVLDALAHAPNGSADLPSLAAATGLHPSTVFRLLETLASRDYVRPLSTGYQIGPRAFEVGSAFIRGASIWTRAAELAESLAEATGETASVGVLVGAEVLYIAIAHGQSDFGIQSVPGTRHPAHCTALGKAMLAAMPLTAAAGILAGSELAALTPNTRTTLEALQRELLLVARQGYAMDDEERALGVRCIGVPIWDQHGTVAAISASGPSFRMQGRHLDEVREAVIAAGRDATRQLGGGVRPGKVRT